MAYEFSRDFLVALSNWQRGWAESQVERRKIADNLVKQCEHIPDKYKKVDGTCFRKRFIRDGEIVPILLDNDFFEGIASWTADLDYAKYFKGIVRPDTKFVMVFEHQPEPEEVVINIIELWKDDNFKKAVSEFEKEDSEGAKALLNFKDYQSEIILRSTLKGNEITDIVGVSSSFEELCDMAGIPEEKREKLSIQYARDKTGLPIEIPTFAGTRPTKEAIKKTLIKIKETFETARQNNVPIDWSRAAKPHEDDLKHKR
ncbi:MAG: hypothetical protein ACOVOQ_08170 [Flavobacterium sp.]